MRGNSSQSALAATADSSVENTNIGLGTANNFRPNNVNFLFTPYHPYDNCSGSYPARNLGTITSTCTNFIASTFNAAVSGAGNCSTTDDNDVWFKFIKPSGATSVSVLTNPATCNSASGTSVEVYSSCGGTFIGCSTSNNGSNPYFGQLSLIRSNLQETLFIRVTSDGDIPGNFNVCVSTNTCVIISDGLVCTDDICDGLGNTVYLTVFTDDGNVCTTDGCNEPSGVFHIPLTNVGGGVNDGLICTQDNCNSGVTVHPTVIISDNNPCTLDACTENNGISHTDLTTTCGGGESDGLACTQDNCSNGQTVHPTAQVDDGNPCTVDACSEPLGITHLNITNLGGGLSDDLICTDDNCSNGRTVHSSTFIDDNNPCTADACSEPNGIYHSVLSNNGGGVNDGLVCTNDDCNNGVTIHTTVFVDDNNPCTSDACIEPTGIFHNALTNTGGGTDDGLLCTQDNCLNGVIVHPAVVTDDGNACTTDVCDPLTGNVSNNFISIDDNNYCTTDACNTLTGSVSHNNVNTSDNNACTQDFCDPFFGVLHFPINVDDGNSCTIDGCNSITGVFHNPAVEICGNNIDDNCDGQIDEGCSITLNLRVFIEGFYLGGGTMIATVDPVHHPLLCDTILAELRNPVYPYNVVYFNRSTIDINGNGLFTFPYNVLNHIYYIAIHHRNAIESWSASPVSFSIQSINYSFTTSANKAYGNNLRNLGDGNFALLSGDIIDAATSTPGRQDGVVESSDYGQMENALYFTYLGYMPEDITGDGIVESSDYGLEENNVYFTVFSMHP